MAGHSHWAGIKHKKGIIDAKRGKVFSKISRMITIAVKKGGSDPDMNPKLELAISKARLANMPKDNIERAIQKGTGTGGDNVDLQECLFEGYGPSGIAIMADALTDNKNRTVPELRKLFEKFGGNMGETGCVSWMFEKKGIILVNSNACAEDEFMMLVLDAGAEDLQTVGEYYNVLCAQTDLDAVKKVLVAHNITIENAETSWLANNTIEAEGEAYQKALHLIEALEDHDDVNNVYSNLSIKQELFSETKDTD